MRRLYDRVNWPLLVACFMAVLAGFALTSCGSGNSSASSSPQTEAQSSETTEAQETTPSTTEAPPEEVGGPLSFVGTITGSGDNTTVSNRYSLGPLLYGSKETPPEEVLQACYMTESAIANASVFARGEVTTTYQEGSLPLPFILISWEELALGGELSLITAFQLDGEWHCNSGYSEYEGSTSIEMQPGEALTVPFWIIGSRVLTNGQPRIPASELDSWSFKFIASTYGYSHQLTVHGPGAGSCEEEVGEEQRLLMYNRSGSC